jgi:hypothetical protein
VEVVAVGAQYFLLFPILIVPEIQEVVGVVRRRLEPAQLGNKAVLEILHQFLHHKEIRDLLRHPEQLLAALVEEEVLVDHFLLHLQLEEMV